MSVEAPQCLSHRCLLGCTLAESRMGSENRHSGKRHRCPQGCQLDTTLPFLKGLHTEGRYFLSPGSLPSSLYQPWLG